MEYLHDGAAFWVTARKVRALAMVATATRPSKIGFIVIATMLFSDDMFQVKCVVRISSFRQAEVFATTGGTLPD